MFPRDYFMNLVETQTIRIPLPLLDQSRLFNLILVEDKLIFPEHDDRQKSF